MARKTMLPAAALLSSSLAVLLIVPGPSAQAQSVDRPAQVNADALREVRGEWKRAGDGLACVAKMPEQLPTAEIERLITRTCLHLGPLVIGDDAGRVRAALGPPHKTLKQPNGRVAWIYFIAQREQYPYYIVTIATNTVIALQVTGAAAAAGYDFNHVALGATSDDLLQRFGPPAHFEPSELQGAELWTYDPYPFSFEVTAGRVMSIRVRKP